MDQILQSLILGIVQGLTEFLPISSSGHLILIPQIFDWSGVIDSLEFNVALHVGTTVAVIWFFWSDWVRIIKAFFINLKTGTVTANFESRLLLMILVGSIPAAIVGLGFKDFIQDYTREPLLVASTLFIFALVLFTADKFGAKARNFKQISWMDAVVIGLAQSLALIPGVSRSGITISAGLFRGFEAVPATRFSFLLSTPAIIGAALLSIGDSAEVIGNGNLSIMLVGVVAAAVIGWVTIKLLLKFVAKNSFNIFVWYRMALAVVIVLYFLNRT